ncbi:MAG: NYN domain-containing protein, partial [Gammaproteobacteria bacterium]|nr:NYN domain-containing protein [Gammaproteobacteria bacterium]NNL51233.1 NYN domain-containing protein [Woeseiaceae bacterium]
DLCYTKSHVNTFVIISGDSDFSPLVSKLRENAKTVIGVGVKNSTSDLLIKNCDEFIYYDDIAREQAQKKKKSPKPAKGRKTKRKTAKAKPKDNKQDGIDQALEVASALNAERGDQDTLWGSMVKQALKRVNPSFNEGYYGFESFSKLLEEAQARGQLDLELDERSGGYIIRKVTS